MYLTNYIFIQKNTALPYLFFIYLKNEMLENALVLSGG